MSTANGRAMTQWAIRSQRDSRRDVRRDADGAAEARAGPGRAGPQYARALTRGPSMPRTAGRNVSA